LKTKTKLPRPLRILWKALTEVPGWPDAPRSLRVRRLLPIALPCLGLALLAGWNAFVLAPQMRAGRVAFAPLQAQQEEIAALRQECSDQQAGETAVHATALRRQVLAEPKQLATVLDALKSEAADRGWDASFHAADAGDQPHVTAAQITYLPVRAKLTPFPANPSTFSSLIALLERFSAFDQRIDLTRLAIRADDQGRYAVELNLRLPCLVNP